MADISKRVIFVLLILVVISSIISTWAFLTSVNAPQKILVSSPQTSAAAGQIQLEIKPPAISTANAEVQLEIIPPNGG